MFGKPPVSVLPTPDKSSTATEQPVPAQWRDDIIDGGGLSYPNMTDRVQQQQEAVRAEEQAAMATAIAKELKRLHGVPFVPPTASATTSAPTPAGTPRTRSTWRCTCASATA